MEVMKSWVSLGSAGGAEARTKACLVIRKRNRKNSRAQSGTGALCAILKNMKKPDKNREKLKKEAGQVFPPPFFPLSGNPASLTEGD
jgi:hypothetical protein